MSNTNKTVAGDLNVERHITAGGDLTVRGQAKICHDLKVEGWLEARNIKGPAKGLFGSVTQLEERYPHPQDGWWAMVGESVPAPIYRADGGAWVATGEEGGTPSIDVSEFLQAAIEAVGGATARFDDIVDDGEIRRSTCTKAGGRIVYVASKKVFSYQIDGVLYSDWLVDDVPSADMYMDDTRTLMQADKLYICGGTCYMSSPDVGLLQLARYSDIEALLSRLQGTSPESSAETDPFLSLGTFTGEDVWEQVAETLNGLVVTEEAETHRRAGLCRLSVDGARVEVVNFPLDYAAQTQVQLLTGCVVSEDGVSLSRGDWQQLVRSHSKEGGWTNWKPAVQGRTDFAGINAIAGIEQYAKAGNAISEVRSLAVVAQHDGKDVTVGRLWMLSDSMTHQLTQVLLTHHEPGNDGSFSAHTDGTVHLWKRSYGLIQGSAESAPIGEWTEWTDLLAKPTVVTGTKDGLTSSDMFTRLLQKQVYVYSDVAPDGEDHITQLGAKLTAWCNEESGVPLLRTYETNSGGANYRQGLALMFRSDGGTEKFTLCIEAADKSASVRRLLLLHHSYGDSGWTFADGTEIVGGGDLSEFERQLEEVAAMAGEAQTGVTEGDPQAGFDGFIDSATIQMSSAANWSRIVFVNDKKTFAAQRGLQYYSSWKSKDEDTTHGAPQAYGKLGKTHLLTTSGELYVRLADGSLEKLAKTSEVENSIGSINDSIEEINSNVIPALDSQIYEAIGINSCTTKTLINETKSGTSVSFNLGTIKTGEIIPQNGWMTIVACVTTSANEPGMSVQADYGEEGYDYLIDQDRLKAGTRAITRITKEHTMMPSALDGGENIQIGLSSQSQSNFTMHWAILYESDPYGNPRRRGGSIRRFYEQMNTVNIPPTITEAGNRGLYTPKYNERTGWFELNGLTDVTWATMEAIAADTEFNTVYPNNFTRKENIRTNKVGWHHGNIIGSVANFLAYYYQGLEVVAMPSPGYIAAQIQVNNASFSNCGNLFALLLIIEARVANIFDLSEEIETCYILPLTTLTELSMKDQAKMSWESIKWMIDAVSGRTSTLTVTVHADVYAKMTGGTVDDWGALGTLAEEKGVKLVAYGESGYPFLTRVLWHGYKRLENKINAAKSGDVIYIHPEDRKKITSAQKDDWAALVTAGAEKQISFALPAES